jgi:DNA modification methylase
MKTLIENSTSEGELVLEPFAGIGSTVLACIESNRNYVGVEIDKDYYNTILYRINKDKEIKPFAKGTLFD